MKFIKKSVFFILLASTVSLLSGCYPQAKNNINDVSNNDGSKTTLGTVQKEIRVGMSQDEVVSALGSPNMVLQDKKGEEVWTYDSISSQNAYSQSSGGILSLFIPWQKTGAQSSTQKTLTVIIRFNKSKKVKNFSYRYSHF